MFSKKTLAERALDTARGASARAPRPPAGLVATLGGALGMTVLSAAVSAARARSARSSHAR